MRKNNNYAKKLPLLKNVFLLGLKSGQDYSNLRQTTSYSFDLDYGCSRFFPHCGKKKGVIGIKTLLVYWF